MGLFKKLLNRYVAFEGIEGAGKGTVIKFLESEIKKLGLKVKVVREPGGTFIGEIIRNWLLKEERTVLKDLIGFSVCRFFLVRFKVFWYLITGHIVITDRSFWTTVVYQGEYKKTPRWIVWLFTSLAIAPIRPAHVYVMDVDSEVGLARKGMQNEANRFERRKLEFHQEVREIYKVFAGGAYKLGWPLDPETWYILDTTDKTIDSACSEIYNNIVTKLKLN